MTKAPEEHADNWDLRHEDFQDNGFLYDVYSVMRRNAPFAHTDTPFLSATPGGAWVATRYAECYRILQDWEHFSSNPTPEASEQLAGDLVITLDPPRQQKFRKVLNPYFSPARMKALRPQIRDETDQLIDAFIELGAGDLAQVAWRQPGIVFFKYLLGLPINDVPLCIELTDTALNGDTEEARMGAWGGLYQHLHDAVSARSTQPPQDDMIDVLLNAEIDGERLPFSDVVANAMLLVQAGLETTANAMSFAFHYLATHPDERDRLTGEPEILPRAVEEFISLRRIDSRHSANCRQGRRARRTDLLPRRVGTGELRRPPTAIHTSSTNPIGASSIVARTGTSDSGPEYIAASDPTSPAWSSRSVSNKCCRGYRTTPSKPGAEAVFHGNSVTRGFRRIPVVFSPGKRAPA